MPPRITAAGPADLVAYVWYGLGFRPRESLVAVGLRGPRREAGAVARIDLPLTPVARRTALEPIVDLIEVDGCAACVLLVVTDEPPDPDGAAPAWLDVLEDAEDLLEQEGVDLVDTLVVGATAFRSLYCPDPRCCPPEGTPLDAVAGSRVAASLVLQGRTVAADEDALVADVEPRTAAEHAERPLVVPARAPGRARRLAAYDRWCEDLDAGVPVPRDPEELLAALTTDLDTRDAVLVSLAPGGREAGRALVRGRSAAVDLGAALDVPPDADTVVRARALLGHLARRAPAGRRGDVLAVLAWLAWATGDGPRGRLLCERALRDRPGHRLASLVSRLLATAVPPPWVRTRGSAAGRRPVAAGRRPGSRAAADG